jgi:hypothetical protein
MRTHTQCAYAILDPYTECAFPFLGNAKARSCNLKVVFSTSQIMFSLKQPFIAADGPENSVPAIGCGYKISPFGMVGNTSQIGNFVEPTSKTIVCSPIASLGTTVSATSTGTDHKISMH